jgi:hypothetical protein
LKINCSLAILIRLNVKVEFNAEQELQLKHVEFRKKDSPYFRPAKAEMVTPSHAPS